MVFLRHSIELTEELLDGAESYLKSLVPHLVKNFPAFNWMVHWRIHNSTPLVPILSKINAVHALPNYFFQIHSNVIFPSTSRSSKCFQIYYSNKPTTVHNYLAY